MPHPSNEDRALRGETALRAHINDLGGGQDTEDDETCMIDMLSDVMHFCDSENIDFEKVNRMACSNFEAEKDHKS